MCAVITSNLVYSKGSSERMPNWTWLSQIKVIRMQSNRAWGFTQGGNNRLINEISCWQKSLWRGCIMKTREQLVTVDHSTSYMYMYILYMYMLYSGGGGGDNRTIKGIRQVN